MYQNHNQTSTMQSLAILDKCTQIIRQDRIWLRNLIKANNQDALMLFKGLPKVPNMKQLQIKIRKYINRAKQRQKQQQLQRFKQNMHLPEFIQQASQKRFIPAQSHNKSQTKSRNPLIQNQCNNQKSSFVAKWNNYTHYNHQNNFMDNKSQISQISSLSQNHHNNDRNNMKKQWSNNYKPHSFNKNLNGQLSNKLSYKNKSTSNLKRSNTQALQYSKQKSFRNSFNNNDQQYNMNSTQAFGYSGRNSSKSLRQLESKIYQELRIFQNNRNNKKQFQSMNRTHSQQTGSNYFQKQKPGLNFPQTQKSTHLSRQNIDQILKFKLGNCDFQSYQKDKSYQNQQEHQQISIQQKNSSHKKLYNQGLFPPIQQQTQRDSQSQRYPEQPLRFGLKDSKQQMEDRHKFTFSSFAKASPQLNKSLKANQMLDSSKNNNQRQKVAQFYQNQKYPFTENSNPSLLQSNTSNNFVHINYQEPLPQKKVSDSLYQSAQKKNDFKQQYLESDLHKSIMNSIRKSRQQFPSDTYHHNSRATQNSEKRVFMSENFNQVNLNVQTKPTLDIPKPLQITNFQMDSQAYGNGQESLFTSPQLLNQCRNFLKKTQQINFENSGLKNFTGSIKFSKFQSPSNSQQKSFKQALFNSSNNNLNFPQPITITQSITKDFYQKTSQQKINSLFQSNPTSQIKNNNIDFQTYSKPLSIFNNENSFKKSEFLQSSSKKEPFLANQMISNSHHQHFSDDKTSNISKKQISQHKILNNQQGNSSLKKPLNIGQPIIAPILPAPNSSQKYEFQQVSNSYSNSKLNNNYVYADQRFLQQNYNNSTAQTYVNNAYRTSQFNDINVEHANIYKLSQNKQNHIKIWNFIEYEDIIDAFLEANQGQIIFFSSWIKHTIQNQHIFPTQVGFALKEILHQFINVQNTYNCLQVFQKIQQQYKKYPQYQHRKCTSRDIYLLLDIEQKGYITFEDIKSFIQQLESAQVQNIQEIKGNLLEVFSLADFMSIQKISYTNLYIIKNQESFQKLCVDLEQFQFQIEP